MSQPSAQALIDYIRACPTPLHAVAQTAAELRAAGYEALPESGVWRTVPGQKLYIIRGGSIAAFHMGQRSPVDAGFRLIGAHTDSPNLRIKPNPNLQRAGCEQLGVEPYGGVLLHTWLDRDLSIAGQVITRQGPHLIDLRRPLLRIPSLAIHLNRGVNKDGLRINAQQHMPPVIALAGESKRDLRDLLAQDLDGIRPDDILGWDLMAYDVQPPSFSGAQNEFIHAARIDNLASCHAALSALLAAPVDNPATLGIVLYDHEEVGSRSAQGAASTFLQTCLQRLAKGEDGIHRAASKSFLVSADMAHAIHPNHVDKHEANHQPILGGGPVIKINANQSYATDGQSWARFESYAREAGVATQRFVVRSDMGCGSTIGPITAAAIGIQTVDVGNPMLSMHSCREMAAASDVPKMIATMRAFFWDKGA